MDEYELVFGSLIKHQLYASTTDMEISTQFLPSGA